MKNILLRTAREKSGKTQSQVAREIGIPTLSYQRYEYGTSEPGVRTAIRIANVLDTTVEALFSPWSEIEISDEDE